MSDHKTEKRQHIGQSRSNAGLGVDFECMSMMQRRLHNAAIIIDSDGDEYGFSELLRESIEEIETMKLSMHDAGTHMRYAESAFAGFALRVAPNDEHVETILSRIKLAVTALTPDAEITGSPKASPG